MGDSESSPLMSEFQNLMIQVRQGGTAEFAVKSNDILLRSRTGEGKDPEVEALIRMERVLFGIGDEEKIGPELKWCMDRLNAISPGSINHGVSILNMAAWHRNKGETMMALATHSAISPSSGHPKQLLGLSRLEVGRMLASLDDLSSAMRHLWAARGYLSDSEMIPETLAASLEWLDIALDEVNDVSPRMQHRIENSKPRNEPGTTWIPANSQDVREVVDMLLPVLLADVSGTDRADLGLVIDAAEMLNEEGWIVSLEERIEDIQDPRLLELLQS
ncbi:MAG: hypothetical protein CMA93_02575 [Euryarchaeota archaeon]|nr:hypothetical protein [Euryarchaeota archaeon]